MEKQLADIRQELEEALTTTQRAKRRMVFRKSKAKILRARKIAQKRMAPRSKLEQRAQRQARREIESRILGGQTKADLAFGTRSALEKKVDKKSSLIKTLAKRMLPKVKQAEVSRLKKFRSGESQ